MIRIGCWALLALLCSCSAQNDQRTVLTVWHFWSEPTQAAMMRSLANAFELENPSVRIELVPLQWHDGKAKLQIGLASSSPPDVVHIGLDWFQEFAGHSVFAPVGYRPETKIPAEFLPYVSGEDSSVRAIPWFVNCRAVLARNNAQVSVGLCSSDPHNVLKRMLPILWDIAATSFCTRIPLSSTLDEQLVLSLDSIRTLSANNSFIGNSRDLDDAFARGNTSLVVSGLWMIDKLKGRTSQISVLPRRSVVNADVLAATHTERLSIAKLFIAFASRPSVTTSFCLAVPEAGFPASTEAAAAYISKISDAERQRLTEGFAQTLRRSTLFPKVDKLLSIEPLLEDMIVRCYDASSIDEVRSIVLRAKTEIAAFE